MFIWAFEYFLFQILTVLNSLGQAQHSTGEKQLWLTAGENDNWHSWLKYFKNCATLNAWDDEQKRNFLAVHLRGVAQQTYQDLNETVWGIFLAEALGRRFTPAEWVELNNKTQVRPHVRAIWLLETVKPDLPHPMTALLERNTAALETVVSLVQNLSTTGTKQTACAEYRRGQSQPNCRNNHIRECWIWSKIFAVLTFLSVFKALYLTRPFLLNWEIEVSLQCELCDSLNYYSVKNIWQTKHLKCFYNVYSYVNPKFAEWVKAFLRWLQ